MMKKQSVKNGKKTLLVYCQNLKIDSSILVFHLKILKKNLNRT